MPLVLGVLVLAFVVVQPSSPPTPPMPPTPPLAGPKVVEAGEREHRPTIVAHDFDGNVVRPEGTAEEAAAGLLALDADAKRSIDALILDRHKILDEFVAGNLDLLTKFGNAEATGNKLDQAMLLAQAAKKLQPLWKRGTLYAEIEKHLPADHKGEFDRLLDEYWSAVRDEVKRNTGEKKPIWTVRIDERLKALGREIERAFKRQLGSGEIVFRYITQGVTLRADQEPKIREACAKFADEVGVNDATKAQQVKLFMAIYPLLDNDQRRALGKRIRGEDTKKGYPAKKVEKKSDEPAPKEMNAEGDEPI